MENQIFELQYAIDTFYFLVCGALVMWMAAGFSLLESGLVRSKNTVEILTKNISLYAVACIMYLATGYAIMYGGGWFLSGIEVFDLNSVLADAANAHTVAMVFLNTNAAAAGLVGALITARVLFGKADLTMTLNGALAGLVAITAEPSTPTALQASLFGLLAGVLVVFSIIGLDRLKIDDPVGAISVHGVIGLFGLLLVPLTNDGSSFTGQLAGAVTIFCWVFGASLAVWFALKLTMGIRVSEEEEYEGLDIGECGMEAYPEFTSST